MTLTLADAKLLAGPAPAARAAATPAARAAAPAARAAAAPDALHVNGHASTWQAYRMYGGPPAGGWVEQVGRSAFDKTLADRADVHLLVNHEGLPLARTAAGTLRLSTDDVGLLVDADLDPADPDVQRIEPKLRRRDMTEMSFAFRVVRQQWSAAPGHADDPRSLRTIVALDLHKGDVSIVNWGANPTTDVALRSARPARASGIERRDAGPGRMTLAAARALIDTPPAPRIPVDYDRARQRITRAQALDPALADGHYTFTDSTGAAVALDVGRAACKRSTLAVIERRGLSARVKVKDASGADGDGLIEYGPARRQGR